MIHRLKIDDKEKNLLKIIRKNKIDIESPCNGNGTCKKCKVVFEGNEVLACTHEIDLKKYRGNKDYIEVDIPDESISKCSVEINDITDVPEKISIALDIGTTGIEMGFIGFPNGREIATVFSVNPQKKYGLDVLTRISHSDIEGIDALHNILINRIDEMIESGISEIANSLGKNRNDIKNLVEKMIVSANCTMTHTFVGEDISSIGKYPYNPVFKDSKRTNAKDLGLISLNENVCINTLPQVSGFIGGDIVSGLYDILNDEKISSFDRVLFIDIGTNGEIVLKNNDDMLSCSCAAGPALEGMNISCGMRAEIGAIENIKIDREGINIKTIGDVIPKGICGSGILAVVRELISNGYIEKMGRLKNRDKIPQEDKLRNRFFDIEEKKRAFLLYDGSGKIYISQSDIRQIQLAKGAIYSAIDLLLKKSNVLYDDIDIVVIAGQFGFHLPESSLIVTGLLDKRFSGKICYVGNSSKKGAIKVLINENSIDEMKKIADRCRYFEIANEEGYDRLFTKSMKF